MKVLQRDADAGLVKVRVDGLDDLWHLHELVEPGDVASALTYRTAAVDRKEEDRGGKAEKRAVHLGVRVESAEFHAFTNRLRLLGPIVEGPQDLGNYHTISVEPPMEVTLRKARGWRRVHEERLQEAVAATARPSVVVLAIEENEAVVAQLRQYGVQKMADIVGHVSGKRHAPTKGEEEAFFDEILMALRDYRPAGAPFLVIGPGFAKERFLQYARGKPTTADAVKGALVEATGQAGMTGVQEALKRGSVDRVSKEQRVALETRLVERLLEAIGTGAPSAYGPEHVRRAVDAGAAATVLVIDRLVREGSGEALLEAARAVGAEAVVISTHHEAGRRLDAMGGVGALLRYPLE